MASNSQEAQAVVAHRAKVGVEAWTPFVGDSPAAAAAAAAAEIGYFVLLLQDMMTVVLVGETAAAAAAAAAAVAAAVVEAAFLGRMAVACRIFEAPETVQVQEEARQNVGSQEEEVAEQIAAVAVAVAALREEVEPEIHIAAAAAAAAADLEAVVAAAADLGGPCAGCSSHFEAFVCVLVPSQGVADIAEKVASVAVVEEGKTSSYLEQLGCNRGSAVVLPIMPMPTTANKKRWANLCWRRSAALLPTYLFGNGGTPNYWKRGQNSRLAHAPVEVYSASLFTLDCDSLFLDPNSKSIGFQFSTC